MAFDVGCNDGFHYLHGPCWASPVHSTFQAQCTASGRDPTLNLPDSAEVPSASAECQHVCPDKPACDGVYCCKHMVADLHSCEQWVLSPWL